MHFALARLVKNGKGAWDEEGLCELCQLCDIGCMVVLNQITRDVHKYRRYMHAH